MAVSVHWNRCAGDVWADLFSVDLEDPHFEGLNGVYMAWLGGSTPAAICVGSGAIRDKLLELRGAPAVMPYRGKALLVTWAKVEEGSRSGIERWLLDTLRPKIALASPDASPIEVNLPGRPGQAPPDAGAPPRRLAATNGAATVPIGSGTENGASSASSAAGAAGAAAAATPPPTNPAQPTAPRTGDAQVLILQKEFLEMVRKAKDPVKGGFFGGPQKKPGEDALAKDMLNMLLREAVKLKASDIHLEPQEAFLRVRMRVDGILEEALQIPHALNLHPVSAIRVACGLDPERGIGTSRPEDGRMSFKTDTADADIRLSTFPTQYGDKAVMRIIPRSNKLPTIDEIFSPKIAGALRELIHRPQGMFVVTGPTGSGKSTTLYGILQTLNTPGRNIVTLEDPIERTLPGISQGLLQSRNGFGFAEGLRAILRQDPNVVMVGEIRDLETAEIAISAALTGHMLFTTLHANSALGVISRLLDMKVEPFLIVSALTAVSAQRLARKVCTACAQPHQLSPEEASEVRYRAHKLGVELPDGFDLNLKKGAGCDVCRKSGYNGRVQLFEYSAIGPSLRKLVLKRASLDEMRAAAIHDGMEPMLVDGFRLCAEGVTTVDEVFRVVDSGE